MKTLSIHRTMKHVCLVSLTILMMLLLAPQVFSQPSPHNVAGRVFNNQSGTGVPNGVTVFLNDTITGSLVYTQTSAPPLPQFLGSYSATISGNDGDLLVVRSWNTTHWGESSALLASTTTNINVTLNQTRGSEANVSILLPLNNSIRNTTVAFNITANITIFVMNGTLCNATLSFSPEGTANISNDQNLTNLLGNISVGTSVQSTWNVSGIRDGRINATVMVRCASDGAYLERKNSATHALIIQDTTPPIPQLQLPLNNSYVQRNITFIYNVTENTGLQNCSLFVDDRLNQTANTLPTGSSLNFTLNETPEGRHTWFVSCTDNGTNFLQGNSSFRAFISDATPPNITLLFPLNNSAMENYTLFLRYNVTDNFNATNCSLSLNSVYIQTNYPISLNISNNFTYTTSGGDYNWSVNCTDGSNNIGASAYFRILSADLNLGTADIAATTLFPVAKGSIWINATVSNIGSANHTRNSTVQFIEHNLFDGSEITLQNFSVNITAGNNATLNVSYTARTGDFAIIVLSDIPLLVNGTVIESNENNNKANITITVPSHHVFYGDVIADILLSTSSSNQVFAWLNATSTGGNLYAADTDSTVSFDTLRPLGRNVSYNVTFDDFGEVDIALNTTNLTTSINRTYTSNGWANYTANFTLFDRFITDVPVVNSTNSSHFLTGILWDYSDSINGTYNGAQDVVFVTRINRRTSGFYGDYDYELKLPATLENYVQGGTQSSVSFYREIT